MGIMDFVAPRQWLVVLDLQPALFACKLLAMHGSACTAHHAAQDCVMHSFPIVTRSVPAHLEQLQDSGRLVRQEGAVSAQHHPGQHGCFQQDLQAAQVLPLPP